MEPGLALDLCTCKSRACTSLSHRFRSDLIACNRKTRNITTYIKQCEDEFLLFVSKPEGDQVRADTLLGVRLIPPLVHLPC